VIVFIVGLATDGDGMDGAGGDTRRVAGSDDVRDSIVQHTEHLPSAGDDIKNNNNNGVNGLSEVKYEGEKGWEEPDALRKRESIATVHLVRPKGRSMKVTKAGRYTSDITMEEIEQHFHLPAYEAARRMGIGLTILKRLCRKFGLKRWPYQRKKFNPEEADAEMLLMKAQQTNDQRNDFGIANSMSGGTETNEFDTSHTTSKNNVMVRAAVQQAPNQSRAGSDEETINMILTKLEGMRTSLLATSQPRNNGCISQPQQAIHHHVQSGNRGFRPYYEHGTGFTTQQHSNNTGILRPSGSYGGTSFRELITSLLSSVRPQDVANRSLEDVYEAIVKAWDQM